ncbi:histone H1 [Pedobacter sp. UYEF25]
MEKFEKIKALLIEAEADAKKFYLSKNRTAGNRLRVHMQNLRNLSQAVSFEIGNLL